GFHETQEPLPELIPDLTEIDKVWGRLFSVSNGSAVYNFTNRGYTFGRGNDVDCRLDNNFFDGVFLSAVSKAHFRISQERRSATEVVTILEDLSCNGTFVNQKLIGRENKTILQNNDEISLVKPSRRVFVFHDCFKNDSGDYPSELTQRYIMTKKLGEGSFGEVRLAYKQGTLERVAVKILKKKGSQILLNNIKQIENEIKLLQSVDHPNIIRLQDVIDTPEKIFIIMEVAEGGELFDRLITNKRLPEMVAKFYFYQLVLAVQYLHMKCITHRDIKPENVLLAADKEYTHVKLTDFGLSKLAADTSQMTTFCGTPTYISPELLGGGSYTNKVDMWSLGVVLYVSLVGYPPFTMDDDGKLRYQIKNAVYNFKHPLWNSVSKEAKDLITKLMVKDPHHRLSADETLNHKWLKDDNMMQKIQELDRILVTARKRKHDDDDDGVREGNASSTDVADAKTPKVMNGNLNKF
ncbi:Checkpoint kinase 2, partial [Halocaridina rubra]